MWINKYSFCLTLLRAISRYQNKITCDVDGVCEMAKKLRKRFCFPLLPSDTVVLDAAQAATGLTCLPSTSILALLLLNTVGMLSLGNWPVVKTSTRQVFPQGSPTTTSFLQMDAILNTMDNTHTRTQQHYKHTHTEQYHNHIAVSGQHTEVNHTHTHPHQTPSKLGPLGDH